MARKLAIEIIGDAASLKAALGSAAAATEKFAAGYKTTFAGMAGSTLQLAVAQDKLAISTAKYGVGSTGAAAATVRFRKEVDGLAAASERAAVAQKRAMGDIGRTLTRSVTLPTVILGAVAVKMGVDFTKQMLMIQTQAGASAQEVKNLTGQVLKLGPAVATGPTELAKGLYHLESLGLRGAAAMKALSTAAIASKMGVADLEGVTTALGGAVVSGIRGAQNFDAAMGTLVATIGVGNIRMEDLVGFLGTGVLPAAKNAGLSLDQVGAALAVMADRGISAENAGTRLRMTFALMQAPSDKAVKALADMGINAEEMATRLRGPNGLMNVLTMLKQGMEQVGKVRGSRDILQSFGGGRSGAAILTLIQSLDSAVSSYDGKLKQIQEGQKRFGLNTKVYMESPAFKLDQALARLQTSFTKLGQSLTPAAIGMAKAIGFIAETFDKLPSFAKRDIGVIIGLFAVGGPLLLASAAVAKSVKMIGVAFTGIPVTAGVSVAATEAELVGLSTAATVTATKVKGIRVALLGLGKMAAILIPLTVAVNVTGDWDKFKSLVKSGMLGSAALQALFGTTFGTEKWFAPKVVSPEASAPAGPVGPVSAPAGPVGPVGPPPKKKPPPPIPQVNIPRNLLEAQYWADITPSLKDDLKVAKEQEAFFRKQLKRSQKGTEIYDTILQNMSQAAKQVQSLSSQIASEIKKSKPKSFTLPYALATSLSVAGRSGDDRKELKALERVAAYLKDKISVEKNVKFLSQEEYKLTQTMHTISSLRASMAKKVMSRLETGVSQAKSTPWLTDDLNALSKLRVGILKQLAVQKVNVDLQKKLAHVNVQLSSVRAAMAKKASHKIISGLQAGVETAKSTPWLTDDLNALSKLRVGILKQLAVQKVNVDLQKKLAHVNVQLSSVRAAMAKAKGEKVIAGLRGAVDEATATSSISDDLQALTKLKVGITKQINLQKGNKELAKQLRSVNKEFISIRRSVVDQLHSSFGALGAGPSGDASNDPIAKWKLGVQFSAKQYLRDLKRQVADFKILQGGLDTLTKKGAPKQLMEELRGQGQAAFPEIFALAHADKGTLTKFFAAYKDKEKLIQNVAVVEMRAAVVNINGVSTASPGAANGFDIRTPSGIIGVPRLAAGGVATRPTLALVGEAGPEAIIPLSGRGKPSGPTILHVDIDGRTIATVVLDDLSSRSTQTTPQVRGRSGGIKYNLT